MSGEPLQIPINHLQLEGDLVIPEKPKGLVIFSHGSGSSRLSPRNRMVAETLRESGFGTLLFDLLTREEDEIYATRFNIELLTERLIKVTQWVQERGSVEGLPLGYFGASTGAASALIAAAQLGEGIKAVVSRGGRPDLAMPWLEHVRAATLLIVGGYDSIVIELNQQAFGKLGCVKALQIVPGASHLFEEPGKLEQVEKLASHWFRTHLASAQ
jgi:pimeloyl-ACP methyl ester carboxylesterase